MLVHWRLTRKRQPSGPSLLVSDSGRGTELDAEFDVFVLDGELVGCDCFRDQFEVMAVQIFAP